MKNIEAKSTNKKWIDIFNLCISEEFKDKLHLCADGSYDYGDRYITPDNEYKLFYYNGISSCFRVYSSEFNNGDGWVEFEIECSGNIVITYHCNVFDDEGEICCEIDGKTHEEIGENCNIGDWMLQALLGLFSY